MKKNKKASKEIKGVIYTVTHIPSGMKYVGVTRESVEKRKKDHLQKARKGTGHYFHEAIATLGPEAFKWEEVDTASSLNELARVEKEYIKSHNEGNGTFNTDTGGGIKKMIYQYYIDDGRLVQSYNSLESAANAVSADKRSISRACLNVNNTYKGYYWSYDDTEPFVPAKDKRRKKVQQFDKKGHLLAEYLSVAEASRQTGISKSPIAKTCRGEQDMAGGFQWKFKKVAITFNSSGDGI